MLLAKGEAELWKAYIADKSDTNRNAIFEHYWPDLKHKVATILCKRHLKHHIPECLSDVSVRFLVSVIPKFDAELGLQFSTFAWPHLLGAISDFMRSLDTISRTAREKHSAIEMARAALAGNIGRRPTDTDVAKHLGQDERGVTLAAREPTRIINEINSNRREHGTCRNGKHIPLVEVPDHRHPPATASFSARISHLSRGLSKRMRVALVLHYEDRLTMRQIGQTFGVSESRMSQEFKNTLKFLKNNRTKDELLTDLLD